MMNKAPESLQQPIAVFHFEYQKTTRIPAHSHNYHQLVYATKGCMRIVSADRYWVVPPQRGVWVPKGVVHEVVILTDTSMKTLYMNVGRHVPFSKDQCCVISVSPLARELLNHASQYQDSYVSNSPESRLLRVLQDQLSLLAIEPLTLPEPQEKRLKKIIRALQQNPGNNNTLSDWGKIVGASSRTLTRLFLKETHMSFQKWRTQFRLLKSIELLSQGVQIQQISDQLGYSNPGAFVHMFHKTLGVTPKHYFKKMN